MSEEDSDDAINYEPSNGLLHFLNGSDEDTGNGVDGPRAIIANADIISRTGSGSSPVLGESFCNCLIGANGRVRCNCGEDDDYHEWSWDNAEKSRATEIHINEREVLFHVEYSCGTAAIRANKPMELKQYFWEIKMMSPVYGTDMMVGVGTSHVNLDKYRYSFKSFLGADSDSWGLSYTGKVYHKGQSEQYSSQFGQGSIIGVHLDMWRGTISYFKNRRPLGIAHTGLQGKVLYPMVSSTAARSCMKIIQSRSFNSSLQFLCCRKLREMIPHDEAVLNVIKLPPGLAAFLENNLGWLLGPKSQSKNQPESDASEPSTSKRVLKRLHSFPSPQDESSDSKISRRS